MLRDVFISGLMPDDVDIAAERNSVWTVEDMAEDMRHKSERGVGRRQKRDHRLEPVITEVFDARAVFDRQRIFEKNDRRACRPLGPVKRLPYIAERTPGFATVNIETGARTFRRQGYRWLGHSLIGEREYITQLVEILAGEACVEHLARDGVDDIAEDAVIEDKLFRHKDRNLKIIRRMIGYGAYDSDYRAAVDIGQRIEDRFFLGVIVDQTEGRRRAGGNLTPDVFSGVDFSEGLETVGRPGYKQLQLIHRLL